MKPQAAFSQLTSFALRVMGASHSAATRGRHAAGQRFKLCRLVGTNKARAIQEFDD